MTWKDLEGWHPSLLPFLFHLPLSAFFVTPPSLPLYHQEVIYGGRAAFLSLGFPSWSWLGGPAHQSPWELWAGLFLATCC